MSSLSWQHYEHGADIGVSGCGQSKADAFAQAALALTAVITDPDTVAATDMIEIHCEAPDDELLFVDWLNALVYEMASRKMLFRRFEPTIKDRQLDARVWGEAIDVAKHQPTVEVKGATYTTLSVHQDTDGWWHAQTVVDV